MLTLRKEVKYLERESSVLSRTMRSVKERKQRAEKYG